MTQNEFLNKLKIHLEKIPKDEQKKILEYYSEIINDKIDEGKTEEQAVAELGSPEQIAQNVLEDYLEASPAKTKAHKKSSGVGSIIGFSVLIPFVIVMLAVLGALSLAFIVASAGFIIGGIAYFIGSFVIFFQNLATGLFQLGAGFFTAALGIFAMYGSILFGKLYFRIIKRIFNKYVYVYGGTKNESL